MSKIMLVAGDITENLEKHLRDRGAGSIDVYRSLDSLVANEASLKSSYSTMDKLVYVQTETSVTFVEDMQVLRGLLMGNGLFVTKEIIFFIPQSSEDNSKYIDTLMEVVSEGAKTDKAVSVPEYSIYKSEGGIFFGNVFDAILGTVKKDNNSANMDTIFLVERDDVAKYSYDERDNSEVSFEPFSFQRLKTYEDLQKNISSRLMDEKVLIDEPKSLPKNNPKFGKLNLPITDRKMCVLLGGNPKSGATTMSCAFSVSLATKFEKVVLIDLSKTQGASYLMSSAGVAFLEKESSHLLLGDTVKFDKGVTLVHGQFSEVNLRLVRHLSINFQKLGCTAVIINVDGKDFMDSQKLLQPTNPKSFYTSLTTQPDINLAQEYLLGVKKVELIMSNFSNSPLSLPSVSPATVKNQLFWVDGVYKPMMIKHLGINGMLAEQMLGV